MRIPARVLSAFLVIAISLGVGTASISEHSTAIDTLLQQIRLEFGADPAVQKDAYVDGVTYTYRVQEDGTAEIIKQFAQAYVEE